MKIVIIGAGKVGMEIATQLTREGHDIVLIDKSRQVIKRIDERLDMMVMYGNGASLDVQKLADVDKSDLLIAVTTGDELNILCCILARKIGCKNTIARVRSRDYAELLHMLRDELNLSMVINPESRTAIEIFRLMQIPGVLKRDSFANGRVEIVEVVLRENSRLDGVALMDLHKKINVRILICAIDRGGKVLIPDGHTVLQSKDKLYITAPTAKLSNLLRDMGQKGQTAKNAIIIGGSRTAQHLAYLLTEAGTRVKIIENDTERCMQLAETLPNVTIINADGTSQAVLRSEGLEEADTIVSLTNIDEENLIISMYANHIGVPQIIMKINRTEYNEIFLNQGDYCVVSPKQLCADEIIRYVRAMHNTTGGSVIAVHQMVNGEVEALEFNVTLHTLNLGMTLSNIQLKPNILIACINRKGRIIIPRGSDTLEIGDTVILVTDSSRVIVDLNDIFADVQ